MYKILICLKSSTTKLIIFWLIAIPGCMLLLHYSSSNNPIVRQVSFYLLIAFLMYTVISRAITECCNFYSRYSHTLNASGKKRQKLYKFLPQWLCLLTAMYILQLLLKKYGLTLKDFDGWLFWIVVGAFGIAMMIKKNKRKENQQ